MDQQWALGYIEAGGTFNIRFSRSKSTALGYQVVADFSLKTISHEINVLKSLQKFFYGIGGIYTDKKYAEALWRATKLEDVKKLAAFLKEKQFVSHIKRKEFENWLECINLIEKKRHLEKQGLLEIAHIRDIAPKRKLNKKKHYCGIRLDIDPCDVYKKEGRLPVECNTCHDDELIMINGGDEI